VKHLIKFFYTANVALMGIENKDLRASFQTLGVDLPGRTNLSGSSLDETHAEVRTQEQGSRAGKKKQSAVSTTPSRKRDEELLLEVLGEEGE
jgi:hypothetical protein